MVIRDRVEKHDLSAISAFFCGQLHKADFAHNPEKSEQKVAKEAKGKLALRFLCGLGVRVFLFFMAVTSDSGTKAALSTATNICPR